MPRLEASPDVPARTAVAKRITPNVAATTTPTNNTPNDLRFDGLITSNDITTRSCDFSDHRTVGPGTSRQVSGRGGFAYRSIKYAVVLYLTCPQPGECGARSIWIRERNVDRRADAGERVGAGTEEHTARP